MAGLPGTSGPAVPLLVELGTDFPVLIEPERVEPGVLPDVAELLPDVAELLPDGAELLPDVAELLPELAVPAFGLMLPVLGVVVPAAPVAFELLVGPEFAVPLPLLTPVPELAEEDVPVEPLLPVLLDCANDTAATVPKATAAAIARVRRLDMMDSPW